MFWLIYVHVISCTRKPLCVRFACTLVTMRVICRTVFISGPQANSLLKNLPMNFLPFLPSGTCYMFSAQTNRYSCYGYILCFLFSVLKWLFQSSYVFYTNWKMSWKIIKNALVKCYFLLCKFWKVFAKISNERLLFDLSLVVLEFSNEIGQDKQFSELFRGVC